MKIDRNQSHFTYYLMLVKYALKYCKIEKTASANIALFAHSGQQVYQWDPLTAMFDAA